MFRDRVQTSSLNWTAIASVFHGSCGGEGSINIDVNGIDEAMSIFNDFDVIRLILEYWPRCQAYAVHDSIAGIVQSCPCRESVSPREPAMLNHAFIELTRDRTIFFMYRPFSFQYCRECVAFVTLQASIRMWSNLPSNQERIAFCS